MDTTIPRLTTSSVSSLTVQWVMGRPDFSGGSQARAKIWVTCSGVNLAGRGAWFVVEDRFDGPSQDGVGLATFEVNESVPGVGPASSPASDLAVCEADPLGDVLIEQALEGQDNDQDALPEPRGCGDGTGKGVKDFLLTLGDDGLGGLARHRTRTPGEWKASEAG